MTSYAYIECMEALLDGKEKKAINLLREHRFTVVDPMKDVAINYGHDLFLVNAAALGLLTQPEEVPTDTSVKQNDPYADMPELESADAPKIGTTEPTGKPLNIVDSPKGGLMKITEKPINNLEPFTVDELASIETSACASSIREKAHKMRLRVAVEDQICTTAFDNAIKHLSIQYLYGTNINAHFAHFSRICACNHDFVLDYLMYFKEEIVQLHSQDIRVFLENLVMTNNIIGFKTLAHMLLDSSDDNIVLEVIVKHNKFPLLRWLVGVTRGYLSSMDLSAFTGKCAEYVDALRSGDLEYICEHDYLEMVLVPHTQRDFFAGYENKMGPAIKAYYNSLPLPPAADQIDGAMVKKVTGNDAKFNLVAHSSSFHPFV